MTVILITVSLYLGAPIGGVRLMDNVAWREYVAYRYNNNPNLRSKFFHYCVPVSIPEHTTDTVPDPAGLGTVLRTLRTHTGPCLPAECPWMTQD